MFVDACCVAPGMSKSTEWRVQSSNCRWLSLKLIARILDIDVTISVSSSTRFCVLSDMRRLFSDAGRSFSFDSRGTGYGRGEGCGMILIKPLDQAIKDNDNVRSVIVGSGINQDGRTPGITMPNGDAQGTAKFQNFCDGTNLLQRHL